MTPGEDPARLAKVEETLRLARISGWTYHRLPREEWAWSDEARGVLGLVSGSSELSFESLVRMIHPDDRDAFLLNQVASSGEDTLNEYRLLAADGSIRWILARDHRVINADGQIDRISGTLQDITEWKHIEAQQTKIDALLRANDLKDLFMASVSHELRTPLTAIKGATGLLLRGREGPADETQTRLLGIIQSHADRLLQMINDILDGAKMEAGRMSYQLEDGDLAAVAQLAVREVGPVFEARGIELALETSPAACRFDPERMAQVLFNLLSNASKFTGAGGRVVVRTRQEHGHAILEVADDGIGISPESLPHVFERFSQEDNSLTRKYGGTGLGLYLCRSIVEEGHGGLIRAQNGPARGTTFVVTLPLERATVAPR